MTPHQAMQVLTEAGYAVAEAPMPDGMRWAVQWPERSGDGARRQALLREEHLIAEAERVQAAWRQQPVNHLPRKEGTMKTSFDVAPDVEEIAVGLIPQHHSHLVEARILYVFRHGPWESRGKTVLGKAFKCSAWDRFQSRDSDDPDDPGADFRIVINGDTWGRLEPHQRVALVDHELCHCGRGEDDKDGNPRWFIQGHDLEEFRAVVARHGLWEPDLSKFASEAARHIHQLTFRFGDQEVHTDSAALAEVAGRLEGKRDESVA